MPIPTIARTEPVAPPLSEADHLRLIIHGVTAFEVLRSAMDLRVFEELKDGPRSLPELSEAIGTDQQPMRVLLLALTSMRLLTVEDGRYSCTPETRRKLLRDSDRFLGPLIDMQAEVINRPLADLTESIRTHSNVGLRQLSGHGTTLYERLREDPTAQEYFYRNMGDASERAFSQILDFYDFTRHRRILDLGGGDGTNALKIASRAPDVEITVLDQAGEHSLEPSRADRPEAINKITFKHGDFLAEPLPTGFDLILNFHLFEIWSLQRNTEFLRRIRDALQPGGTCLVYAFSCNDEGSGSLSAGLVSPYFLALASGEGMTYSPSEMAESARCAGFSEVRVHENLGFSHTLLECTR